MTNGDLDDQPDHSRNVQRLIRLSDNINGMHHLIILAYLFDNEEIFHHKCLPRTHDLTF